MGREPEYIDDEGCELYPTCLGNEKYPVCPFRVCVEDLNQIEYEFYDRKKMSALRRWFFEEIGR